MCDTDTPSALPKPRLILRLGGLGNRTFGTDNHIDDDPTTLKAAAEEACKEVFAKIDETLVSIHEAEKQAKCGFPSGVFDTQLAPKITVLTGGAEGGDSIIRDTALARNDTADAKVEYEHLRIVPEDPSTVQDGLGVGENPESLRDLKGRAERKETLTRQEAAQLAENVRKRAYGFRAQSEALRHHSDILLAIWDPDAEGKAGGTSESVMSALQERIPVIAIRLRGGKAVETHVLECVEDLRLLQGTSPPAPAQDWKSVLEVVIGDALRFPDPPENPHHEPTSYHPRVAFAAFLSSEPLRQIWPHRFWKAFDAVAKCRGAKYAAAAAKSEAMHLRSKARISAAKAAESKNKADEEASAADEVAAANAEAHSRTLEQAIPKVRETSIAALWASVSRAPAFPMPPLSGADGSFALHYGRAKDRAASRGMSGVYGDAHRGAIIASYFLAALAVVFALFGAILHVLHTEYHWHLPDCLPFIVAFAEVGAIAVMAALSVCARSQDWNVAYTDSRILAEALRIMEFLGPLGVHTPLPRLPYYLRGDKETAAPEETWSVWYFRALVRMAPLRLTATQHGDLKNTRDTLTETWIKSQIDYHVANTSKQEKLHHDIESLSTLLFWVIGIFAALHVVDLCIGWHGMFLPCLVICVAGPALIAAMHGFASQIEISRLRQRSSSMVELLKDQQRKIREMDLQKDPRGAETVWGLNSEVLSTAALMMDEAASWSMLYKNTDIHAG